jgi:hypothetical protein
MPAFGLASSDAAQGASVQIVTFGSIQNLNLSSLFPDETFVEGDPVFVQTGSGGVSGSLTTTRPTGSNNLLQNIGQVVRNGGGGDNQIKVGGAGRSNATPNLDKGYLFVGHDDDCSRQDDTIYVSSSARRVGINTIPLDSTLEVDGTTAVSGNVNIRLNNQFFQGYSTANANVSLIGVHSDDVIHVGNLGYDISLRDSTSVEGNISGSGTAQFVGATILGNDLSVSGSTIMESLTANGITNVGTYSGSSTLHVDSDVLVSGSVSASAGLSAGTFISSSLGIHVTGANPHIAIGDKFGGGPQAGMLSIRPSDTSNKVLALMQATDADGGRIALGVSGSGRITGGGSAFDGVLNVVGSDSERLVHVKSDTYDPVFYVSGSGDAVFTGSVRGRMLHTTTHKYNPASTALRYLRFDTIGADAAPGNQNKMVSPYGGRLIKVVVRGESAGGVTTVHFYSGSDGQTNLQTPSADSVDVNMASADTSYTFAFSGSSTWNSGQIIGLAVDPTADTGQTIVSAIWEFDQNT